MRESTVERATGNTESTSSNKDAEIPCTKFYCTGVYICSEAFSGLHLRDT